MSGHFAPTGFFAEGHGTSALPMPAAYLRLLLRRFGTDVERAEAVLEGTGLSPEQAMLLGSNGAISVWQQLRQLQNICTFAPQDWALEIGPALHGSAHGALAAAIASAPDFEQALAVLERFAHLRAPYFHLDRASQNGQHILEIAILPEVKTEFQRSLVETLLISVQALLESALGEPISAASFTFPFPAPDYAHRYQEVFSAPVSFSAESLSIATVAFPETWLDLTCAFANESQHQRAKSELEIAERALTGPDLIVTRVEQILEACPGAPPNAEEVAQRIYLSRRTLVRRLAECNTSFRSILNEHAQRRAEQLLSDPNLTIAEIGHRLGYTDPANFGRAFRRWFGCSPSLHPARRSPKGGASASE